MQPTNGNDLLSRITRPTLLLDESRCRRNIQRMADKARASQVRFRPHFKTHQSAQIGAWFREVGVQAITVSSVTMAEYFAASGWNDITIAFSVNWREIEAIDRLATSIHLGLLVDSPQTVRMLAQRLEHPADVWLDVDDGYHRTGVAWDDVPGAQAVVREIQGAPRLTLRGLLTHSGQAYGARSHEEIRRVCGEAVARLSTLRQNLAPLTGLELSIGDTPSCSVVEDLSAVEEIRPGNFVYYDVMQTVIGSCSMDDIAVAVVCPVVSKNESRRQIVVYGGGVHLSKDSVVDRQGRTTFGAVALPTANGWGPIIETAYVRSLSQEHGVISADAETFHRVPLGGLLMILPVHSCMTADLLKHYVLRSGERGKMMPVRLDGIPNT